MQVTEYVREKAYQRFIKRGGCHGDDFSDWLEAEKSVPERAWVGYRPAKLDGGGFDKGVLQPGIANWEELFLGRRRILTCEDPRQRAYISSAWLDERDGSHTNGEFPDEMCWGQKIIYPFADVYDLADRDMTIQFHGPILIHWNLTLSHGNLAAISFRFLRHPDTCCIEIPRIHRPEPFRSSQGEVHAFRKGQRWNGSKYNKEEWD